MRIVSVLKGEDSGSAGSIDRAAADKYAEENNLKSMFKDLMADVVKAQEDDPEAYIIKKLSSWIVLAGPQFLAESPVVQLLSLLFLYLLDFLNIILLYKFVLYFIFRSQFQLHYVA